MKIALYAGTYVKDKDGAVKSIYQLVSSFRKNGHEVIVWSPDVAEGADHDGLRFTGCPLCQSLFIRITGLVFFVGDPQPARCVCS